MNIDIVKLLINSGKLEYNKDIISYLDKTMKWDWRSMKGLIVK